MITFNNIKIKAMKSTTRVYSYKFLFLTFNRSKQKQRINHSSLTYYAIVNVTANIPVLSIK